MNSTPSDAELLRRYVGENSEAAFAELVQRHLDLVFSAALRQLRGDAHRAEDVTQVVFATLARKAGSLTHHPVLAGWLYTATQHAATKSIRTEARRQVREKEAHVMNDILATHPIRNPSIDWDQVRPVLDEAMRELNDRDREAVLLRYFAQRPFAEIGTALNLSEDGARMRIERALDKLHAMLTRRGVTSTTAALATGLAGQATVAAPTGLAATITGSVLASSVGGGMAAGILTVLGMKMTPTILLAGVAAVVALNVAQQRANAGLLNEARAVFGEYDNLHSMRVENQNLTEKMLALVSASDDAVELVQLRTRADELRRAHAENIPYMWIGGEAVSRNTPPEDKLEIMYSGGRSSPMRAFQTLLSTGREHQSVPLDEMLDMHALMFCLDEQASENVAAFLAAKPDEAREKFHSPERLLAAVFDLWLWRGDQILRYGGGKGGDEFISGDPKRALTHWDITYSSGKTQQEAFPFMRFDDGWRYGPLTGADVEQMLSLLDPTTGLPKTDPPLANQQTEAR